MSQEKENFVDRWSRLKQEEAKEPAPLVEKKEEPLPALPPIEQLTPDSDFTPFMDPRVDLETRRAALKKLFADPRFNVPDPFEAYSEDYNAPEVLSGKFLKALEQARHHLADPPEKPPRADIAQSKEAPPQDTKDVAGKQDA